MYGYLVVHLRAWNFKTLSSLLYLSILCPFLLLMEKSSKKYWRLLGFFIFLHRKATIVVVFG